MPAKRRKRSATSGLNLEAIEIRKLMAIKEMNELLAEVVERFRAFQMIAPQWLPSLQTPPQHLGQTPLPPGTIVAHDVQGPDYRPQMPAVTTSPTGCQICGNPYAVFTEVRPGLSQYLCQIHARERSAQRAADAKTAAAGFSVDKTDARPQNIRLPEDNQRAKVLLHPTAADDMAMRQHAKEHPDVPDHVEFDEADDETA